MTQFAIMRGYIVTANDDGTIPLNSKVVGVLDNGIDQQQLDQILTQANSQPDLLAACHKVLSTLPDLYDPLRMSEEDHQRAGDLADALNAAIARAEGRTDD